MGRDTNRGRSALVVGAGVSGLAASIALARRGWEVEVWEERERTGGLLAPFRFRGIDCDLGSHRIHRAALEDDFLRELTAGLGLQDQRRRGRLVFGDRHCAYPPSLTGLLRGLGARRALAAGASWLVRPGGTEGPGDAGFESFVVGRVGRSAYEGFYRPYAEKVWGLPPAELSQTVAKKRYSSSSPGRMLRGRRREALDRYMYPHLGMAGLARHLRSTAERAGVRVRTGKAFDPAGAEPHAAVVVHTGRLRDLAPDAGLAHRGTYLVYLCLARTRVSPVETWYLPERRFWFGRVSEPQNYSRGLRREGETVLCLEIPEGSLGGGLDFTAHVDELMDQLREARILRGAPEVLEVSQHFLPDVYPIYRRGWHDDWQRAMDRVAGMGKVFPVGRQGLFLHCNIDHCVTIAKQAVEHIHAGGTSEAWAAKARGYLGVRVRD